MSNVLDSFWRAAAYLLLPRLWLLTLLPVLFLVALTLAMGLWWWDAAVTGAQNFIGQWALGDAIGVWLMQYGLGEWRQVIAPLLVVVAALPVLVMLTLLLVSVFLTPTMVRWVVVRRFDGMQSKRGSGLWRGLGLSLMWTFAALIATLVSMPFWLIPPVVMVLPPLIWGWLTSKVMSHDVLSEFASTQEMTQIMRQQRWPLLGMGVVCGYLGAAPTVLFGFVGAFAAVLAPLLAVVLVWVYTVVFAFSSCWFAHFSLKALQQLRQSGSATSVNSPQPTLSHGSHA